MWRLRIGAKERDNPHLLSTNNYVGRQIWEFDSDAGSPNELDQVDEARRNFSLNRSRFKASADLLWRNQFLREKNFEQKIPLVKIEDAEKITYEDTKTAMRRGILYFTALQADDGHWPAENSGSLFFEAPFVICLYITGHLEEVLTLEHRKELLRYMYNHQNEDGGWGLHVEGKSVMFCTVLNYISQRILGLDADHVDDDRGSSCARARKWIIDHGGATYTPLIGKAWLALLGVYEWSGCKAIPPEFWMLPSSSPINGGTIWVYLRDIFLGLSYLYGKKFVAAPKPLIYQLREELYPQCYEKIVWSQARYQCAKEDIYYPQTYLQDLFWKGVHMFSENMFNRWPFNKLIRQRALKTTMELMHYHDESTRYITGGCVPKPFHMLACWVEDPEGDYFKKHLARVPDYIWIGEDGLKIQSFGSQMWDTVFSLQVMLAAAHDVDVGDDIRSTLIKGYHYLKKSQVTQNPPGDYRRLFKNIVKGGWTFSDQDQGWVVADCTAESIDCCLVFGAMPPELIGEKMDVERLYDAVNLLLLFQSKNGGMTAWEKAKGRRWLEWLSPVEFMEDTTVEHEYIECTGAVTVAFVRFRKHYPGHRKEEVEAFITNSVKFIENLQMEDGSWYGNWGVCFLYATFFSVRALVAAGKTYHSSEAIRRAVQFFLETQNFEGGWGESYLSCPNKKYTPLEGNRTNVVSTGQALISLIMCGQMERDPLPVHLGAKVLINSQLDNGDFPQQEIMGSFKMNAMLHYANYRNIFPLWALAYYTKSLRMHSSDEVSIV